MNETISKMLDLVHELEQKLDEELHRRHEELQYSINNGKIIFERELLQKNKALKDGWFKYVLNARWAVVLTAPFIYSLIIPFVLLDLFVWVYQTVCFPVYHIPKVRRGDYLVFDRVKLGYLNGIQKLNCAYCSYGNGIIAYASEVAARTEQYWCPIKHAEKVKGRHKRYALFVDYGDGQQYFDNLGPIRRQFEADE